MAYQNFYATTLYGDIGASDTTIALNTPPTATSGRLALEARNATQRELISYTGVSGNQITGVVRGIGGTTAKSHTKNSLVEMNLAAEDIQDLYTAFASFSATNGSGWYSLPVAPIVVSSNGQKEHVIRFPGVDYTSFLNAGTKIKANRTGITPTTSMAFTAASSQYANRLSASLTGINFTNNFTCEALVYLDNMPATGQGIVTRIGANQGWQLELLSSGQVMIHGYNGSYANERALRSFYNVPTGRWVHIAATLDMSGFTSSTCKIVIDGVDTPVAFVTNGTAPTSLVQEGNLQLGGFNGTNNLLNGKLANVRVWSTIRTLAQIRDNMGQEVPASTTGLVGQWKGNGSWNDSSSNLNHLTAVNGAVNNFASHPYSATEYMIETSPAVYTGGNTDLTVFTGSGFLPNETLSNAAYSTARAPYGFPADKNKWTVRWFHNARVTQNTANSNWLAMPSSYFSLPTGAWSLSGRSVLTATDGTSGGYLDIGGNISQSNTSYVPLPREMIVNSSGQYTNTEINFAGAWPISNITTSAMTTLYLMMRSTRTTFNGRTLYNDLCDITAECAYL